MTLHQCSACENSGSLKYAEKINLDNFTDLTFASRKRPELMHYALYECSYCKTLFTSREVDINELLRNYELAGYDSNIEAKSAAKSYVKNISKALVNFKGSILDVGAGDGAFLAEALDVIATKVVGVEPSIKAIEFNHDPRVEIIHTSIENFQSDSKFDLITCFQTIEHLNNPKNFIKKISGFVKPGGYIAVTCHDRMSFINRILGEKSPIFDVEHLQIFTRKGIETMFQQLDLEIIYSNSYKNSYPLSYWFKLAPIGNLLKDYIQKNQNFFSLNITINVGNHLIVGKVK